MHGVQFPIHFGVQEALMGRRPAQGGSSPLPSINHFLNERNTKMAGRYLVTGVQLGMFKALAQNDEVQDMPGLIDKILTKQYVGTSKNSIYDDVDKIKMGIVPYWD